MTADPTASSDTPQWSAVRLGRSPGRGWRRVTRGVHVRDVEQERGWTRILPDSAVISHLSAASMHGWWLPQLPAGLPLLVDQAEHHARCRRPGIRVTRTAGVVERVELDGLPVASPASTLLACARDLALLDLVVLVDAALRSGCSADAIRTACAPRRRGAPALRAALELADARSESPGETLLRVLHVVAGADVMPQHGVVGPSGQRIARGDLWLTGTTTLHEYDGAVHRSADQHRADVRRDRALTAAGWTRRGYVAADLRERPSEILRDIDAALERPHDPARLRRWLTLWRPSCATPEGRARLLHRLTPL